MARASVGLKASSRSTGPLPPMAMAQAPRVMAWIDHMVGRLLQHSATRPGMRYLLNRFAPQSRHADRI